MKGFEVRTFYLFYQINKYTYTDLLSQLQCWTSSGMWLEYYHIFNCHYQTANFLHSISEILAFTMQILKFKIQIMIVKLLLLMILAIQEVSHIKTLCIMKNGFGIDRSTKQNPIRCDFEFLCNKKYTLEWIIPPQNIRTSCNFPSVWY